MAWAAERDGDGRPGGGGWEGCKGSGHPGTEWLSHFEAGGWPGEHVALPLGTAWEVVGPQSSWGWEEGTWVSLTPSPFDRSQQGES